MREQRVAEWEERLRGEVVGRPPSEEERERRYDDDCLGPIAEAEDIRGVPPLLEEEPEEDVAERGLALLRDRRRLASLAVLVVLMIIGIYVIFPRVVGVEHALDRVDEARWYWVAVAAGFSMLGFLAYATLFRGVLGGDDEGDAVRQRLDLRASAEITMAGFVATVLFSAAGAGGVALTYWALRRAGMPRRRAACRMVAFLCLLYTVYLLALILFGVLLRTGVLPGDNPAGGTIVPAAVAGFVLLVIALASLIPRDFERRIAQIGSRGSRLSRIAGKLASVPATLASGVRTAYAYLRHPARSLQALLGALGWWTGQIGILWASFHGFGVEVPLGVVVQAYFVGMVANLAPSPAAGVGTVDAGLIGAFVLFGIPAETVFPAVLTSRLIAIWLPLPLGIWGYTRLRKTVQRWREEDRGAATIQNEVTAEARG